MVDPHFEQGTLAMFICGDSNSAKAQVMDILKQFGWDGCDCGKITAPFAELLGTVLPTGDGPKPAVFVCGNDPEANRRVSELVTTIGAEPVDAGALSAARFAEPAAMLLVHLAYKRGFGGRIGTALLRFR